MTDRIPANPKALREAFELSEIILRNIELNEISLTNIAFKAMRLARLLNDFDHQKIMEYESAGYPTTPQGIGGEVWRLAQMANRVYEKKDDKTGKTNKYAHTESIALIEEQIQAFRLALQTAVDPNISVSSANPHQWILTPEGNVQERIGYQKMIKDLSDLLAARRTYIYNYILQRHYELKFSGVASDVFSKIRQSVDSAIGLYVPNAVQKFSAVYENLDSENPEDWANAVHSCRRILQDLADVLFPPRDEERVKAIGGGERRIKLGKDCYINRLMCYIDDNSSSERFTEIVGSSLSYLGDRLDAVFKANQKGSHHKIARVEADRYVVYTYLIVGDILSLHEPPTANKTS